VSVRLLGTQIDAAKVVQTIGSATVTGLGGDQVAIWHTGAVIVDAVLRVPQGPAPSIAMCKNYRGPATVTVTRLTDGETPIASVTDSGTDPTPPPGTCENALNAPLDRAGLIGPVRWPARQDPRPLVLADYYPWYDAQTLQHDFGDEPTGPATSTDPTAVRQAIDLASSSGIDGFAVEYEGTPAMDPRIDLVYDEASRRGGFQTALLVDLDLMVRRDGLSAGLLDRALGEVAAHALAPSQLLVNGQPVMFLYGAHWVNAAQWTAALDRLRTATGIVPFVVADDPALGAPARFDYSNNRETTVARLESWAASRLLDLREQPALDGAPTPLWVAPVSPGYDNRRTGQLDKLFVPRAGGQRFDDEWSAALGSLPDWVLVTSWNEYYEQTHVMPGTATGMRALGQLAAWAARFHQSG